MHGAVWTPEIDAEIVRLRRDERLTTPAIAARVNRTVGAVYARFRNIDALIMDRREWSADETARLVELIAAGDITIRAIGEELGRNENSVRWKLDHLGIKPNRRQDWTPEQLACLRDAVARDPKIGNAALAALVGRSETSVSAKVVELGLRPARGWTVEQIAKLRAARSLDEAVATIGRDRGAVLAKAYALEIRFPDAKDMAWTAEANDRLRALIAARGEGANAFASIAADFGRTARAIQVQARKLGLVEKKRRRRPLDASGRAEIVNAAKSGMPITVAIKALGRDVRILRKVAEEEGVAFKAAVRVSVAKAAPQRVRKPVPQPPIVYAKPAAPARSAAEVKAELVRIAAASTVPVKRIESAPPKAALKAAAKPQEPRVRPVAAKVVARAHVAPVGSPQPATPPAALERVIAPTPPAGAAVAGKRSFNTFVRSSGKDGGRDAALALRANTADAVARFLAERGATKAVADPVDETIAAIRSRGYSLVRQDAAFVIDGRHHLADDAALFAFAEARGLRTPTTMQAAE